MLISCQPSWHCWFQWILIVTPPQKFGGFEYASGPLHLFQKSWQKWSVMVILAKRKMEKKEKNMEKWWKSNFCCAGSHGGAPPSWSAGLPAGRWGGQERWEYYQTFCIALIFVNFHIFFIFIFLHLYMFRWGVASYLRHLSWHEGRVSARVEVS